jgi:hypothetical protein
LLKLPIYSFPSYIIGRARSLTASNKQLGESSINQAILI